MTAPHRNVVILMFDGVEVLDFAGPFEVFSVTAELAGGAHFAISLVAERPGPVTAVNGLRVLPDHTFGDVPAPDGQAPGNGGPDRRPPRHHAPPGAGRPPEAGA